MVIELLKIKSIDYMNILLELNTNICKKVVPRTKPVHLAHNGNLCPLIKKDLSCL